MARAVAIAVLIYSIGVWILYTAGSHVGFSLARGMGQIQILLGGLIFGIGMGIAGSCIFSSEWRAGAGSVYSITVFLSTVLPGMPATTSGGNRSSAPTCPATASTRSWGRWES